MDMEGKLVSALDRAVAEKRFKNVSMLCQEAGVDQGSISAYLRTKKFLAGQGKKPARLKPSIQLDVASKLVDALGGVLIFPWEEKVGEANAEIARLQKEVERLKSENTLLDKKLYACEEMRQKFENMITQQLPSVNDTPVEGRKNKSSA